MVELAYILSDNRRLNTVFVSIGFELVSGLFAYWMEFGITAQNETNSRISPSHEKTGQ